MKLVWVVICCLNLIRWGQAGPLSLGAQIQQDASDSVEFIAETYYKTSEFYKNLSAEDRLKYDEFASCVNKNLGLKKLEIDGPVEIAFHIYKNANFQNLAECVRQDQIDLTYWSTRLAPDMPPNFLHNLIQELEHLLTSHHVQNMVKFFEMIDDQRNNNVIFIYLGVVEGLQHLRKDGCLKEIRKVLEYLGRCQDIVEPTAQTKSYTTYIEPLLSLAACQAKQSMLNPKFMSETKQAMAKKFMELAQDGISHLDAELSKKKVRRSADGYADYYDYEGYEGYGDQSEEKSETKETSSENEDSEDLTVETTTGPINDKEKEPIPENYTYSTDGYDEEEYEDYVPQEEKLEEEDDYENYNYYSYEDSDQDHYENNEEDDQEDDTLNSEEQIETPSHEYNHDQENHDHDQNHDDHDHEHGHEHDHENHDGSQDEYTYNYDEYSSSYESDSESDKITDQKQPESQDPNQDQASTHHDHPSHEHQDYEDLGHQSHGHGHSHDHGHHDYAEHDQQSEPVAKAYEYTYDYLDEDDQDPEFKIDEVIPLPETTLPPVTQATEPYPTYINPPPSKIFEDNYDDQFYYTSNGTEKVSPSIDLQTPEVMISSHKNQTSGQTESPSSLLSKINWEELSAQLSKATTLSKQYVINILSSTFDEKIENFGNLKAWQTRIKSVNVKLDNQECLEKFFNFELIQKNLHHEKYALDWRRKDYHAVFDSYVMNHGKIEKPMNCSAGRGLEGLVEEDRNEVQGRSFKIYSSTVESWKAMLLNKIQKASVTELILSLTLLVFVCALLLWGLTSCCSSKPEPEDEKSSTPEKKKIKLTELAVNEPPSYDDSVAKQQHKIDRENQDSKSLTYVKSQL